MGDELWFQKFGVGSATVMSTALSVGYAFWTIRGGYLLASALSSLSAWRMVDPLPVLGRRDSWITDPGIDALAQ